MKANNTLTKLTEGDIFVLKVEEDFTMMKIRNISYQMMMTKSIVYIRNTFCLDICGKEITLLLSMTF